MPNTIKVFVSVGTPGNQKQHIFREAIFKVLRDSGLDPVFMTERDWDYKHPLRGIKRTMTGCCGVIVVAYERYGFRQGYVLKENIAKEINNTRFPTAWNQIEAAMAYEKELPLLVIAQEGIREDAIFENTGDINPFWTKIDPAICQSDGFFGYLRSWKLDVEAFAKKQQELENEKAFAKKQHELENLQAESIDKITLKKLFSSLSLKDFIALGSGLIAAIAGLLSIGYTCGIHRWPF